MRTDILTLLQRLEEYGYAFDDEPMRRYEAPHPDTREQIAALEALVGPIPLSLRACYEVIGAVNFMGNHPAFEHRDWDPWNALPDPLVILPIDAVIEDCRERLEDPEWDHARLLDLPIAPDIFHKADISGGSSYGIYVPDASADALLRNDWHDTTFVNYLRICVRWAGFPGLERYGYPPTELLAALTKGLLPL